MHRVVALALPEVVAFDLAIPSQVFGHPDERPHYACNRTLIRYGDCFVVLFDGTSHQFLRMRRPSKKRKVTEAM